MKTFNNLYRQYKIDKLLNINNDSIFDIIQSIIKTDIHKREFINYSITTLHFINKEKNVYFTISTIMDKTIYFEYGLRLENLFSEIFLRISKKYNNFDFDKLKKDIIFTIIKNNNFDIQNYKIRYKRILTHDYEQ